MNSVENKNNYNKEVQDRYKAKCTQIAIRYGLNDNDIMLSQAIEKYCHDNNCSRGSFTRVAIMEKLEIDEFLSEWDAVLDTMCDGVDNFM